jgi:hypothetical protein
MNHDFARALEHARFYRTLGLVPLGSRLDSKRPVDPEYAKYRTERLPTVAFTMDEWRTTNIQLITGARTSGATKIVVVDLDSKESVAAWKRICSSHDYKPNHPWIARTGGGGWHIYYRLPPEVEECRSRLLWGLWDTFGRHGKGDWCKHKEVRLLGDGSLVVAPPSFHVDSGKPYYWVGNGKRGPVGVPLPETAPEWLLAMPGVQTPKTAAEERVIPTPATAGEQAPRGRRYDRAAILQAVHPADKVALARGWGLRIAAGSANGRGFLPCHAIDRDDSHPSCSFHVDDGFYKDQRDGRTLSFFDLAVALGAFRDWRDCAEWLERRFLPYEAANRLTEGDS